MLQHAWRGWFLFFNILPRFGRTSPEPPPFFLDFSCVYIIFYLYFLIKREEKTKSSGKKRTGEAGEDGEVIFQIFQIFYEEK
jgi:hypothetical protein